MKRIQPNQTIIPLVLFFCLTLGLVSIRAKSNYPQIFNTSINLPFETHAKPVGNISDRFPQEVLVWQELIEKSASNYALDPNLVAAIILQESGGNPDAYSSSGAVGLMQVMPKDGNAARFICRGNPCFINRPTTDELWDPSFNIDFGCRLLSSLIKKYGSARESLKHYGPMDVGYNYAEIVLNILDRYQ